jgi:hypothetical protein
LTKEIGPEKARKTTLLVGLTLAALAAWQVYRGRTTFASVLGASAALLGIVAAISPAATRFQKAWMSLAALLGFINSRILLTLFYYAIMTPAGWVRRMLGSDPMSRREPRRDTYWLPRAVGHQTKESFERPF